jgi:hypothetical protein
MSIAVMHLSDSDLVGITELLNAFCGECLSSSPCHVHRSIDNSSVLALNKSLVLVATASGRR